MTWAQRSLERVVRAGLAIRAAEEALASSQMRLQTSQSLLDQSGGALDVPGSSPKADEPDSAA